MSLLTVKTLFFDAAGTLLHPAEPIGRVYARVAQGHGWTLDPREVDQRFRQTFQQLKNRPVGSIPRNGDDREWWREVVHQTLPLAPELIALTFEKFFQELYELYASPSQWLLYPEVEEALETLHQRGYRLAIISNWDRRLRPVLEGHHLTSFFQEIYISTEMGVAKPSTAIFRRAQEEMKCPPAQALMIGDDPELDVATPQSLGWQTFLVARPSQDLRVLLDNLMI
jgi:putative hydrolase of the HAD superfamily